MRVTVGELIAQLERDGWELRSLAGDGRHYAHPRKPGLVALAGDPGAHEPAQAADVVILDPAGA